MRGAHGVPGQPGLHRPVEGQVVGHDHVRVAADPHRRGFDAARGQRVELADQRVGVDHDAGADDAADVGIENAGGHEVELEHLASRLDGVAGVVAALVAHDHGHLLGQEVGGLALALVAPLKPDDYGGRHRQAPPHPAIWPAWRGASLEIPASRCRVVALPCRLSAWLMRRG